MEILKKYPTDYTVEKMLPGTYESNGGSVFNCGFAHRKGKGNSVFAKFKPNYYSAVYVIRGEGLYKDAKTGMVYPVTPGSVIQRMPGVEHFSSIAKNSNWTEFYISAPTALFVALAQMKQIDTVPVFYAGKGNVLHEKIENYVEEFKIIENYQSNKYINNFINMMFFYKTFSDNDEKKHPADKIAKIFEANINVGIPLNSIAEKCGMSYASLRKIFPKLFGCSMEQYRITLRINKAKSMIINNNMPIKEIARELGYCDSYAFSAQFKHQVGKSPQQFARERKQY